MMVIGIFWISVFFFLYPYLFYPLLLAFFSLFKGKKVKKAENYFPYLSVVISAYNERNVIREKIENTLSLNYPKDRLEIIVASESTDATNEIVRSYTSQGVKLCAYVGRLGKVPTLIRVVETCKGEILVFSDANGMYHRDALCQLARNYADERVGAVCGKLVNVAPRASAVKEEGVYWGYEEILKRFSSRLFSLPGGNGSIFSVRKDLFQPLTEERGDDFELPIMVLLQGKASVYEEEAVCFEETTKHFRLEASRKTRIYAWNIVSAAMLLRQALEKRKFFLAFQLLSHKLIRYFGPVFLLAIFVANVFLLSSPFFLFILFGQVMSYSFAMVGFFLEGRDFCFPVLRRLFTIPLYFCVGQYAALHALMSVLRRQQIGWAKLR